MGDGIRALAELAMMAPSLHRASILAWTLRFSSRSSYTHSYKQTHRRTVEQRPEGNLSTEPQIDTGNGVKGISTELINVCNGVKGISTELINVCNGVKGISTELINVCNCLKGISTELINVCNGLKGISTEQIDMYNHLKEEVQKTQCYTNMHESDDKNFPYICN